ncbi:OprO/OprP family phosphate-selective porin [Xanthomonas sp. WHRI 7945]|nr:porin [Xanthomonas campestris pv. campestris]
MDLKKLSLCGACACALLSLPALARAADGDDDGPVTAELGGRLHWDFAQFDNDGRGTPNPDDTEIRRLWLDVSGKFFGFGYKVEGDFAGLQDDFNSKGIEAKDVYLTRKFEAGTLSVGQFKQYFSLDDRTGSNFGQFLERSGAASTLAPLYRKAVSWQAAGKDYTWAASVYSLESIDVSNIKGDAFGGRGTWAPGARDGDVLHLGLSLAHERYDHPGANGAPALSIRPRPAGHLSDDSRITLARFADGRDTDVDKWSLEYAQVRGPLSWQGEFSGGLFDDGAQRAQVMSAYGFVSWFATGESRRYDSKTGRFTRIAQVNNPRGAFELALRYDRMWGTQHLDGQADFLDASTASWTLAGNWYLKPNLRLMLNLIDSRNRDHLAGATLDRTRAITGRFQYDF